MKKLERLKSLPARSVRHWGFWVSIAIVLGLVLGISVFNVFIGKPNVGIVRINSSLYPWTVPKIVKMLKYAEENDDIKAVVLEIDSPGGDTTSTEELYLDIVELRKEKPVVAYINLVGASGGYYVSVAANFIYAKPSSTLGSVGAWGRLPERGRISEEVIRTGPYKVTGSSRKEAVNRLEMLKESFLQAVMSQRGDQLKISEEELSKAAIYNGVQGLRYGLVDEIGSSFDAVQKAAELAGLRNYGVIDINKELNLSLPPWWQDEHKESWSAEASKLHGNIPIYYYLYIPPEAQE